MYLYGLAAVRLRKDGQVLGSVVDAYCFYADPDPGSQNSADADPDPGQTLPRHKRFNFDIKNIFYVGNANRS
jgi:hypothetical protein